MQNTWITTGQLSWQRLLKRAAVIAAASSATETATTKIAAQIAVKPAAPSARRSKWLLKKDRPCFSTMTLIWLSQKSVQDEVCVKAVQKPIRLD